MRKQKMFQVKENVNSECLYLQKEEKSEVLLNNCQLLKQHQIDGLRFLYLQFKKEKPAAVVNFPPECGKSVTVALFLNILKNIINKPILILCSNKSEISVWNDIILKWTEYTIDNIAIDSSNVYIKKKIFIKHMENLAPYTRRSWSVLVMKDDINKNTLKLAFDADFKIWITSTDVKKDLKMLSIIYNLLTKQTMDAKDFMPSGKSVREKLKKTVLLDSFLEDFLLQETKIKPFTKIQISKQPEISTNEVSAPKKSRKNKDATGTKIKRSKTNITNDNITYNDCQNQTIEENNDISNENNDNVQINLTTEQNKVNENENSESLLGNYDNVTNINMEEDLTEEFTFGNAAQNIVENENVLSNKSTESMDFDEVAVKIMINDACDEINDNDNMDTLEECDESNDKCHREVTDNEECFVKGVGSNPTDSMVLNDGDKVVKKELVFNETVDKKEKGTDIDTKISELEEKALKKFKGSLLDSIF